MQDESNNDELLDRATGLLHDTPVAQPPGEDLIAQTLSRLAVESESPNFNWKIFIMKNRSWAAAAVIAIVSGIALLWAFQRQSSVAFGDVLAKVRDISAVSFNIKSTLGGASNQPAHPFTAQVTVEEPSKMREVLPPGRMIAILDCAKGQQLMLDPIAKTAERMEFKGDGFKRAQQMNMLDQFRNFDSKDFHPVGTKIIDQHKLQGFVKSDATGQTTVWVDPATRLPMRMEMSGGILLTGQQFEFTDFNWNPQVDDNMFSLTPPAGYKLSQMSIDMSSVSEQGLISGLRHFAEFNNGQFPDSFTMADLMKAIRNAKSPRLKPQDASNLEALKAAMMEQRQQSMKQFMPIARAIAFVDNSENGSDWHYAGKGVKLNDSARPIMWYKPKGLHRYRVIDATLHVSEVDADHLPQVPSEAIGSLTAPPVAK
jgi:outer membrane lipoprotein-sorting protein